MSVSKLYLKKAVEYIIEDCYFKLGNKNYKATKESKKMRELWPLHLSQIHALKMQFEILLKFEYVIVGQGVYQKFLKLWIYGTYSFNVWLIQLTFSFSLYTFHNMLYIQTHLNGCFKSISNGAYVPYWEWPNISSDAMGGTYFKFVRHNM